MTIPELSEITRFLEDFRLWEGEQVADFQTEFNRLRDSFSNIREQVLEEARQEAPSYNVFSLLGLSRNEARTHSAMLANLLDPRQSHGQQYLFLESFLNYCSSIHKDFPLPSDEIAEGHWIIRPEVVIIDGRIDILIQSPDLNCLYVIENKIDSPEQERQLFRYGQWMKTLEDDYPTQALIFLTIRGDVATSSWGVPYFQLSYHKDISNWLMNALEDIQAPNVQGIVSQYLALIQNL